MAVMHSRNLADRLATRSQCSHASIVSYIILHTYILHLRFRCCNTERGKEGACIIRTYRPGSHMVCRQHSMRGPHVVWPRYATSQFSKLALKFEYSALKSGPSRGLMSAVTLCSTLHFVLSACRYKCPANKENTVHTSEFETSNISFTHCIAHALCTWQASKQEK